jgi:hypothetical protein
MVLALRSVEKFVAAVVADKLETCFYEFACFLLRMGNYCGIVIDLKVNGLPSA